MHGNVADEAVHKELGDSLVRAATTASSLEVDQDNGNINKTQSKATPNESSSQETNSGGGPWCQETIGDTIAQTRSRIHRLKRLYKVGLTARVESSDNEESLGEDASKQGRIDAIDADEEITLVSVHDVNVSAGEEVFATTVDDITLAQVLEEMKSTKPKKKGVVIQELGESTTTISLQLSSQQSQDKGKGILIEPVKPINKKDQIRLDEETALNLQAEFDEEERLAREKAEKEEEANIALIETWDDIQAKIDVDHQLAERMQAQEQEELSIEEKATLFQQLLEKRRKHFAAKRAEEKRNKPPTKAQQRKIMCTYLKNMEGYKLKDLKLKEFDSIQEMFDRAFKRVNTFEDFRTELVEGKEKRAGTELIQEITKKQKVEDDKETAEIKKLMEIILDEEEVTINAIPLAVKSPNIKAVLTQKGLDIFRYKFHILEDVHPQLPSPNQTIHEMPVGKIGVYTRFFEYANFRLPLSTFLVNVLRHFHINLSQLSVIAAAKVSHFEILCRVHNIEPTVGFFRCFYVNSKNKGWMSFSKRSDSDASTEFNADDYAVLVAHPAPLRKFSEPFLCLVGMSRYYTLDEDTYLKMDLSAFIHVVDPTKVKVVERECAEGEKKLLESTVGRVVRLLSVAPTRSESKLEASVDKLFDEGDSADQGDFAADGGHDAEIELVMGVKIISAEVVIAERPRRKREK
ncbi:hypothetical protein Tco_0287722 [Tanacetum coccineum]